MQQDEQEQQKEKRLPAAIEPAEQEGEPGSTSLEREEPLLLAEQRAREYLDLLQRTQADFVNYRRRMNQEQAEARAAAQREILSRLLPVLDDFGRALGATPPDLANHPWTQGLSLIARRLTAQLDQLGVRQLGTPGEPFDPHWHEAIATEACADRPEGTILQVMRPGYALGERVIRPAQVVVSASPTPVSGALQQQEDV